MRILTATLFLCAAAPALAAPGGVPGANGAILKGSSAASGESAALGLGSVPLNAGALGNGNVARTDFVVPGNGNVISLPSQAAALGLGALPSENESDEGEEVASGGSGAGGVTTGGMSGGGAGGGLYVDPSIYEEQNGIGSPSGPIEIVTDVDGEDLGEIAPVPVPASIALLGLGLAALPFAGRRRRRG